MLGKLHARALGFVRNVDLDQCAREASERTPKKQREHVPAGTCSLKCLDRRKDQAATDMMMSSALGSGMAMGVMACVSRKRSSFLVSTASSTMAKWGRRERFVTWRA